jgi:hypothetical protein
MEAQRTKKRHIEDYIPYELWNIEMTKELEAAVTFIIESRGRVVYAKSATSDAFSGSKPMREKFESEYSSALSKLRSAFPSHIIIEPRTCDEDTCKVWKYILNLNLLQVF